MQSNLKSAIGLFAGAMYCKCNDQKCSASIFLCNLSLSVIQVVKLYKLWDDPSVWVTRIYSAGENGGWRIRQLQQGNSRPHARFFDVFAKLIQIKDLKMKLKNLGFSEILKFDLDSNSLLTEWLIVTLTDPSPDLAIPLLLDARQEKNEDNKNNVESKLETGASWWLVHVCIVLTVL